MIYILYIEASLSSSYVILMTAKQNLDFKLWTQKGWCQIVEQILTLIDWMIDW